MKKGVIRTILMSLGISLSIGLGAFAVNKINKIEESKALSSNTHLYVKVTDSSQLAEGDTIVLVTPDGKVFDCPAGNPRFLRMENVSGMNYEINRLYCDESQVDRLKLHAGSQTGSFALECLDEDYYNVKGKYLSWVETYDIQPHDQSSVGYYYSNIAFRTTIDDKSSWFFTFDSTRNYRCEIDRSDEPAENYGLYYGGSYTRPCLCYTWYDNNLVNDKLFVFKEVDRSDFDQLAATVISQPTKNIYSTGEQVDLSGLELYFEVDGFSLDILYDNEPNFFSNIGYAQSDGYVYIEYCEMPYNVTGLTIVSKPSELTIVDYIQVSEAYNDYRGTYVLATISGSDTAVLRISNVNEEPNANTEGSLIYVPDYEYYYYPDEYDSSNYEIITQIYTNYLHLVQNPGGNSQSKVAQTPIQLVHDENDPSKTYIYGVLSGTYLSYQIGGDYDGYLISKDTPSSDDAVTINEDGSVTMNNKTLVLSVENSQTIIKFVSDTSGCTVVKLYKKATDDTFRTNINTFVSNFLSKTSADCLAESVQSTTWTNVQQDYDALSIDEKGYLANIEYIHSSNEGLENEYNVVDRYDYIVSKYDFADFMDRKAANTWQDNYIDSDINSSLSNVFKVVGNKNVVMVVAILISVTSLSALIFVFYKKKKHQ